MFMQWPSLCDEFTGWRFAVEESVVVNNDLINMIHHSF
jgi:hypothetical protein